MEAKRGLILVVCLMILAQEMACYPTDVRAKLNCLSEDDMTALAEQKDLSSIFKFILKKLRRFGPVLLPILKQILRGIQKSKNPIDILVDIISVLEGEKEEGNENEEGTNEEEKEGSSKNEEENNRNGEESNTNEEENNTNEEENNTNEGENNANKEDDLGEEEEADSGSGQQDVESQKDSNEAHHKYKVNGPDEW